MMNKILLAMISIMVFSSIVSATTWTYYDDYKDDYYSDTSWIYPDSYGDYYESDTSWIYPESETSWIYPEDDYGYNDYYYSDYYYSDYYNTYPWYYDYISYDYYPSAYNYYSSGYQSYPGFTYVSDLRYDHNVNYYIDPIVPSLQQVQYCNDPSGSPGDRTIMGINTRIEFECQDGVWKFIRVVPQDDVMQQGAASKRDFYLDP